MRIMLACLVVFLLMPEKNYGTTDSCRTIPAEKNGLMGPIGNMAEYPGPAVIFSDPVFVPAFRLRFVDEKSSQSVVPTEIQFNYSWKWLEYPYPEHSWGVWSNASDLVECTELGTEILIPEFVVQPRGWYDGKYAKFPFVWKGPSFTGLHISFKIRGNNYFPYAVISHKEVKKLKNKTVVVMVKPYGKCDIIIK